MSDFPWHPAVVHLPLGLSLAQPLFVLVVWLMERRRGPSPLWGLLFLSQCLILFGTYFALRSGDWAEPKAIGYVDSARIYAHATQGTAFLWAALIATFAAGGMVFLRSRQILRILRLGLLVAVVVTAWLGIVAGHSGGELVYRYGAASAYANTQESR